MMTGGLAELDTLVGMAPARTRPSRTLERFFSRFPVPRKIIIELANRVRLALLRHDGKLS